MQKFIGSKFFDWDMHMYNDETDEPAKARSSDVNEELGQVRRQDDQIIIMNNWVR